MNILTGKRLFWIALASIGMLVISCDTDLGFDVEPELEFIDIQPKAPVQFQDSIVITLKFRDGDGDLGDENKQVENMVLRDTREWLTDEQAISYYNLPDLTPETRNPAIQGTITIEVPPTAIRPGLEEESTSFEIFVIDRADNKSNVIVTDLITIKQ